MYDGSQPLQRLSLLKRWRNAWMFLALLLSFTFFGHRAEAQVTATLNGTVTDSTGAVIPGASVTVINEATKEKRDTVANGDGYFALPALLPSSYTITISAKGFKGYEQHGIALNAGDVRKIPDLALSAGSQGETVSVEANTQIIPTDNGQRAALLDAKDIEQLAIEGRNVTELLKILPGVTSTSNGGLGNGNGSGYDPTVVSVGNGGVGNGLTANGTPNRGGTSQLVDGVDVDDPGCNCNGLAVIDSDMTQEVSVQTSNFGADAVRGPVVINTVSKSGTSSYHGEGYFYARNDVLNANDWQSDKAGTPKGSAHYYYPGGNFGGPIPFTKKKVLGWVGYERFLQNTGNSNRLQSFIPTPDMMAGNFTNTAANVAFCGGPLTAKATNGCNDLTGTVLPDGTVIGQGSRPAGIIPSQFLDPGAKALASFWPTANADPATTPGGYNYNQVIPGTHDGYIVRGRVDYNFSDRTSFFVSYQYSQDQAPSQGNGAHIYWTPGNSIPYPGGGLISQSFAKAAAGHFTHVFGPTLTNEFVASWGFGNFPVGPPSATAAYRTTLGYPTTPGYGTVFKTGSLLIPSYSSAGTLTFPDFSQQDIFESANGKYLVRKELPAFADNVTKVVGVHTIKAGFYAENVGNIQGASESPNGALNSFNAGGHVYNNLLTGAAIGSPNNPTANFLLGNVTSYSENSASPVSDMAYQTLDFYGDDSWKVTKRFTAEVGFRFEHIGHWYDRQGNGLAVFLPDLVASDHSNGKLDPGVYWHGINPALSKAGSPDRFLFVSPRLGLSYDLFGTGKTLLRGGWGRYRFSDQYNDYTGALTTAQGIKGYNLPGNTSVLLSQIGNISAPAAGGINGSVSAVGANDYGIPVTDSYNFTISQQVPWNSLVEVAYVGNSSQQLLMGGESISGAGFGDFINVNKVPLGAFFRPDPITGVTSPNPENLPQGTAANQEADYHPYATAYGNSTIDVNQHVGYANYNSLQMSWVKRSNRLTFNANFTYSKSLGTSLLEDPFNLRNDYGYESIDRPYVFNSSYAYNFGRLYHGEHHFIGGVTNGWTLSGITLWQSGNNLQANNSPNFGLSITGIGAPTYFGTDAAKTIQPVETCNPGANLAHLQRANLSCFAAPTIGSNGPSTYQYLRNSDYFDTDLAAYKSFAVAEHQSVQFRISAFNWVNHPLTEFSGGNQLTLHYNADLTPNTAQNSSTLGFLDTKAGGHAARIVELAAKYYF